MTDFSERSFPTVFVTGASGFVGTALCQRFRTSNIAWMAGERGLRRLPDEGIDTVIHLAARVHVPNETGDGSLSLYREANVLGTINLARNAVAAGVKRLIFVSTIKVNGEGAIGPYTERDKPHPADPYAVTKWEAEQRLWEIAAGSSMEVVVVRPPLVYGPGVKANFLSMMRWLERGIPLPFGAIRNKRSLVALENLVDLLVTCIDHPAAANETFLVSDGEDLSTPELLVRMALALGRPALLLPVPPSLLIGAATLLGRQEMARRLCGSLQVDMSKATRVLGWSPPITVDEGLRAAAAGFLAPGKAVP